jgi:DNA sulfur modification protein DndD
MILTSLILKDFGVFSGQHSVDLAPKNRRPIILFGGKNGSGKSTILEALRVCLYGAGALGPSVTKEDYLRFLGSKIHTNPNMLIQPSFASIQVEFSYSHADGLATYSVTRSWERRGSGKVSEFLTVERSGNALADIEAGRWQDFIKELIPPGVSQLFFFDGEKIQQLAEDTTDQRALADAIKSLLGVDIIERLQDDLRIHLSRLTKPIRKDTRVLEIRELEKAIGRLKRVVLKLRQQRTQQDVSLQRLKADILRAEDTFAANGGAYARDRDTLIQREAMLRERISQLEETIRQQCAGLLPCALVPRLCTEVKNQILLDQQSAQINAGQELLRDAKAELTKRLDNEQFLSEIEDISPGVREQVRAHIRHALNQPLHAEKTSPSPTLHQLSDPVARLLLGWIDQATSQVTRILTEVSTELEKAHRDLQKTTEALRKAPADHVIRPILDEIHRLNEKLARISAEIMVKDQSINEAERDLRNCERRYAQVAGNLAHEAKRSGKFGVLPRVQSTLQEYRLKLIEKKVAELQQSVTESFNLLCRKKDSLRTIKIDPKDFSITLYDRQNQPIPKVQLSAGEKQIYAISMLWALGKTSGRPLPIIIDTPLARLDSDHRRLLVQHYFPLASHQVIVLSTDTEVDEVYFDELKPATARAYHLDFDQQEGSTVVKQGYFWRERDEAYKIASN